MSSDETATNTPPYEPVARAAIVGDATLVSQCVEIARSGGIEIAVVATEHPDVRRHATELGIACIPSAGDLAATLGRHRIDCLFSIANLRVLPDTVVGLAPVAINFHDGPLPGYAGLNATTWALLHGEAEHAITWHLMTDTVDAGQIVAVERFAIGDDDTAFSLNARCYEAAITSFPAIVAALRAGTLATTPQPEGERRVFRRYERPVHVLDPAADAATTVRAVRALALGHQTVDTMGSVHLLAGGEHLTVSGAQLEPSGGAPIGTVLPDDRGVRIAASGGDILITALERPDGRTPAPTGAEGLRPGDLVPSPPAGLVERLRSIDRDLARREHAWRERLTGAEPVTPSVLEPRSADRSTIERPLPDGVTPADVVATLAAWSWRLTGAETTLVAVTDPAARELLAELAPLARSAFARLELDATTTFDELRAAAEAELATADALGPFLTDLVGRDPERRGTATVPAIRVDLGDESGSAEVGEAPALRVGTDSGRLRIDAHLDPAGLDRVAAQLETLLSAGLAAPGAAIADLPLLGTDELAELDALNRTDMPYDGDTTIDRLVAEQAERTPEQPAVTADGVTMTYRQLLDRTGAMAARLRADGVGRGDLVGVALDRSIDMLVAVLATHRCGAAYVPLDPGYPDDRLRFMVTDSGLRTIVAQRGADLVVEGTSIVRPVDAASTDLVPDDAGPHGAGDLAYVIYTSGSTGTPKGVLLEHRNVVNFFAAMDDVIDHDPPGVWLAVTSLSFDISVLELLWTLTRGFHVVLQAERPTVAAPTRQRRTGTRPVTMSLFYFAAGEETAHDGYRLLLDSARWADAQGFEAVWTPERHFHAFGGAYPNPSVAGAALATVTEHIDIRAGSVVAPLHSPARIAEEWSVVDNLSRGRVGISFAAGWQPNDFVLNPGAYENARAQLPVTIDTIRALWRGETIDMPGHDGAPVPVTTLPRPVQPELPVWLTSAGSTSTFEQAGTLGLNLLTHLLGQSIEQLADNIACYRKAWADAGHAGQGRISLMLHTYLHDDADEARRVAHEPMKGYLGTAAGLLKNMASAFPTFAGSGKSADEAFRSLTPDELDQLLEMAAGRYLETSGLFGTVDDAVDMIERCSEVGVDEVACLIDFGIDTDAVLESLPRLGTVKQRLADARAGAPDSADAGAVTPAAIDHASVAQLVDHFGATHLQCTPSLATMLIADPADRAGLPDLRHIMLGGEALPTALARELRDVFDGRITNMYGPTETTIWSLVHELDQVPDGSIPIGHPIGNTTIHVLDPRGARLPIGVFGELHIGGDGVARGYHERPNLTAERFVDRPGLGRVYATGDVVRVRGDGVVEFAGRSDHQVKIRGHRIELGEIETALDTHPDVVQSIVVAHARTAGDPNLVAFVVTHDGRRLDDDTARSSVGERLPDAYVPGRFVQLDALPVTPNGKVDRSRLIAEVDAHLASASAPSADAPELDDDTERLVAEVWAAELGRPAGRDENFFEIGGNSLLAVSVFRQIGDRTGAKLALTDVFRYPTIRTFAAHLAVATGSADSTAATEPAAPAGLDRGELRRRAMARRGG